MGDTARNGNPAHDTEGDGVGLLATLRIGEEMNGIKKVLIVIGTVVGIILAFLLGRRNSQRTRIRGIDDDIREIGESVGRTEDSIEQARRTVGNSRRLVGESLDGNKEAEGLVGRAKEILGRAESRGDNLDGDNRVG